MIIPRIVLFLFHTKMRKVNLIPFNASCAEERYKEPPEDALGDFLSIVTSYGHLTTIRQPHGR